uniref:Uncharacterized protein n=1 Tax=Rhizophora mucronata TaxID=61149 RepID=A0A2P2QWB2_RHIMU
MFSLKNLVMDFIFYFIWNAALFGCFFVGSVRVFK